MEETIIHAILPVTRTALGAAQAVIVRHIADSEVRLSPFFVRSVVGETVDEADIGFTLVWDVGDVVACQKKNEKIKNKIKNMEEMLGHRMW